MGPLSGSQVYFFCLLAPALFLKLGSLGSARHGYLLRSGDICKNGARCSKKCPSEWMFYENTCYGVFTNVAGWDEAEVTCYRYNHGHLASILNKKEMMAISRFITSKYKSLGPVWIGLHDPYQNRRWKWTDLSLSSYLSWNTNEPNNRDGKELCVHLVMNRNYMRWNDARCSLEMAFICKYDL